MTFQIPKAYITTRLARALDSVTKFSRSLLQRMQHEEGEISCHFSPNSKTWYLGPVDGTNWCNLFLNLHIDLQQVIIEHLSQGDDGWDYLSWMVYGDELVIHWENFDFMCTHCALIKLLVASEVIK